VLDGQHHEPVDHPVEDDLARHRLRRLHDCGQIQLLDRPNKPGTLYFGHLVWSFAYGKLRWMGGGISRFDFNVAFGAGVTDDSTSRGATVSAGIGTKFFLGRWFALRFDARDHVLREVLVGDEHLVNDVIVTLGASVFIPFGG